jgi:hypothetical protein
MDPGDWRRSLTIMQTYVCVSDAGDLAADERQQLAAELRQLAT